MTTTHTPTARTDTGRTDTALLILRLAVGAAMVDAWAVNVASAAIWENPFNAPFLIGAGTTVVLLAGAGRISVDAVLGRANWPTKLAVGLLVAAFVVAILTWVALLGTNPIHLTDPA